MVKMSRKITVRRLGLCGTSLLILAAVPAAAWGQSTAMTTDLPETNATSQDVASGDIIVTARKREEKLQDVPVSVTAFSGANLDARGYQSVVDIQQSTPNLNFTPGTGGTSSQISAYIRGVGEYDYIITSDPAVAVFVDGVYQARPFGAMTSLLGIDRIEVLRGPQGSLFGKNTIGGAINIVLQKPTGSDHGKVDVQAGSYASLQGRASYDGSLSQDLSYIVSVLGRRADGWQRLDTGGTLGNQNQLAGRAALRWHPGDFDAVLSVDGLHQRQNSAAHSMIAFEPTFFSGLFSTFVTPCCTVPASINRTGTSNLLNIDNADGVDGSLTMDFSALGGHVKSISAIRNSVVTFARDGDASAVNFAGDRQHINSTQYSQEFQVSHELFGGRVKTLLGLYGFYERAHQQTLLVTAYGLYPQLIAAGFDPALAAALDFNIDFDQIQTTKNLAAFGSATVELSNALSLDIGGRYTWEHKDFDQTARRIFADVPLIPGIPGYHLQNTWHNFSPKITLNYKIDPDVLLYALVSQGFRSGGFNGRPTSAEAIGGFDPEKLTSYEAGIKSDLFSRKLRINISGFYNQYRDMQVVVQFPLPTGIVARTENAGRARIWGFEFESRLRATNWLTFDGSVGYLNARYQQYFSHDAAGNVLDYSNLKLKHTPPWSASLGATATAPLSPHVGASLRIDGAYQDRQFVDVQNTSLLEARPNVILNASINFKVDNGMSFGVEAQNLTNRQVIKEGFDSRGSFGFVEAYYNPPRRIFANVRYEF
jgi:iron complex outermembrane receptor protein